MPALLCHKELAQGYENISTLWSSRPMRDQKCGSSTNEKPGYISTRRSTRAPPIPSSTLIERWASSYSARIMSYTSGGITAYRYGVKQSVVRVVHSTMSDVWALRSLTFSNPFSVKFSIHWVTRTGDPMWCKIFFLCEVLCQHEYVDLLIGCLALPHGWCVSSIWFTQMIFESESVGNKILLRIKVNLIHLSTMLLIPALCYPYYHWSRAL